MKEKEAVRISIVFEKGMETVNSQVFCENGYENILKCMEEIKKNHQDKKVISESVFFTTGDFREGRAFAETSIHNINTMSDEQKKRIIRQTVFMHNKILKEF